MSEIEKEKKRISATATATPHKNTHIEPKSCTRIHRHTRSSVPQYTMYNQQGNKQEPKVTKEKCIAMHFFRACFCFTLSLSVLFFRARKHNKSFVLGKVQVLDGKCKNPKDRILFDRVEKN